MLEKLKAILVEEMDIEASAIVSEAELMNDLGFNSLELADMILLCEEKFGIEVKDDDIHKFVTVGDVVKYLEAEVGGK